ncbi:MAG TPA: FG-GAP-like repeat-containing protein [Candidatus Polarisedimenticolia bacterium]|nr:FG-GAP-like repeat-containing protein [Candidatus Polarisedimenticolia bacterium]
MLDFASWGSTTLFLRGPGGTVTEKPISLPLDPAEGFHSYDYVISTDLNRDGIPDAVVAQPFVIIEFSGQDFRFRDSTNLYAFLADGHGGFVRSQKIEALDLPGLDFKLMPGALKDFTGDGIVDYLGFGSGPRGSWEILPGDGTGHFLPPDQGIAAILPNVEYATPPIAASGDLNGDGLPDLFLRFGGLRMSTGLGQWSAPQALSKPYSGNGPIGFQDVNGDGRLDLQFFDRNLAVTYLNGENGTLGSPQELRLPLEPAGSIRMSWDLDAVSDQIYFGYPSYSYGYASTSLSVFLSSNGGARDSVRITPPSPFGEFAATGDFDGDGHKDLLFAGGDQIVIYRGNGRGDFRPIPGAPAPLSSGFFDAIAADLNHDGRDDVVTLNYPTLPNGAWTLSSYLGQLPRNPPLFLESKAAGIAPTRIAAGDLNGDGNPDVVMTHKGTKREGYPSSYYLGGTISVYLGEDGGRLGEPSTVIDSDPPGWYPAAVDVQIGRVNGDSVPDLLILFSDLRPGGITLGTWADGLGDGRFGEPYYYEYYEDGGIFSQLLPPTDVNGDGLPDLSFFPSYSGYPNLFGTFLGHDEEFFSQFSVGSDCCNNPGRHVDLDGDGFLDLLGALGDFLEFGEGAGTGEFHALGPKYSPSGVPLRQGGQGSSFALTPPVPLFADFNEDGREDVVISDSTGPILLLNRTNRVASDPAESLEEPREAAHPIEAEIDLAEIQAKIGSFDFLGNGSSQGALIFTLSLNDRLDREQESEGGRHGAPEQILQDEIRRPETVPPIGNHRPSTFSPGEAARPKLKSGTFQLFLNCGEPLLDSDRDGSVDLGIANAPTEPGLSGIPLADVSLTLRLDGGGPPFAGLHDLNRFSTVDRDRGVITFVIPYDSLLESLTPAERAALEQGDGTGRIFFWAVSRLYGDRDRVPDTNDGEDPTIRSEVGEFRFPIKDLRVTPQLTFKDVLITTHLDGPLTFANHGVSPVTVGSVELPESGLSLDPPSPFAVPPAGRQNALLRYAPTAHETLSGLATIHSDDPGRSALQFLPSGRGVAPIAEVAAELLDFGSVPIGLAGSWKSIEIRNAGDAFLNITWDMTDPYAQFSFMSDSYYVPGPEHRSLTLYPNETKRISLVFRPTQLGPSEGQFRLQTDDPFRPQIDVKLQGTGTAPEPRIYIDQFYFRPMFDVPLGGESNITYRVSNSGSAPLHILSATSSLPEFTARIEPEVLPPDSVATLTVTFRPTTWGTFNTVITVLSDDPTLPSYSGSIEARVPEPPPQMHVSTTHLDFGDVRLSQPVTRSFDLSNTGTGSLRITGPIVPYWCPLQADPNSDFTVLPGETRTVQVIYTADYIPPDWCDHFSFETNDPAMRYVDIEVLAHWLLASFSSPDVLYFPETMVGRSSTVNLSIVNNGEDDLRISSAQFDDSYFYLGGPLPDAIPPGGSALVPVVFRPNRSGSLSSYLMLSTNDPRRESAWIYLLGYGYYSALLKSPFELNSK